MYVHMYGEKMYMLTCCNYCGFTRWVQTLVTCDVSVNFLLLFICYLYFTVCVSECAFHCGSDALENNGSVKWTQTSCSYTHTHNKQGKSLSLSGQVTSARPVFSVDDSSSLSRHGDSSSESFRGVYTRRDLHHLSSSSFHSRLCPVVEGAAAQPSTADQSEET